MAAVASLHAPGYAGACTVDSVVLPITQWTATDGVGTFDQTNATSSGNQEVSRTIRSLNGSFTAIWLLTDGAPDFATGSIYAIALKTQSTQSYTCNALITSIVPTVDIRGGITYSCNFMSNGSITTIA